MKNTILIIGLAFYFFISAYTTDKPAYIIYNTKGKQVTYKEMIGTLEKSDVVFYGELHNNPIAHWLELELTKDFYKTKKDGLVLGAEMFEADNQLILDEYIDGIISSKKFKHDSRLWSNYETDYKPLIEFAKDNGVKFVATNIPGRYASVVYMDGFEGLDSLSLEAKKYMAPLPIEYDSTLSGYSSMLDMSDSSAMHASVNLPKAQAVKDATMAWFIYNNRKEGGLFFHYNGSYHSDNYEGIIWYLNRYSKNLKIATISTVTQECIDTLSSEYKNTADFIICVPESMTSTYE